MPEPLTLYDVVPGKIIADRYEVVGAHRQGGFSTAFEVVDRSDQTRCELQLFPSALFESSEQAKQFRERLAPWREIDTPNVLRVLEILDVDSENLALITAFPGGESLRRRLNRDKILTRDEVLAIGRGLLSGLADIHGRDLVHGDIKPYTIDVVGSGGELVPALVDGGVTPGLWMAKDLGDKTQLIGTPFYAPIEQFGGDAPDVRSDIYNVAVVLYECITGVLPWPGTNMLEVFQLKLQDPPAMRTRAADIQVDGELESVIRQGCLADRRKRYESAAAFLDALEKIAD